MRAGLVLFFSLFLAAQPAQAEELKSGLDTKGIDTTIRPQDNLFLYANGEWLKHTPIPDDKSNYGSFSLLEDDAQANIREIIAEAVEGDFPQGSNEQKIGDFFLSYMDEETLEARGIEPLREELEKVAGLESKKDVVNYFGYAKHIGVTSPIGLYVDQDDKNSSQYLAVFVQSGTTLPDRDYYLEDDQKYQSARQALCDYVVQLYELSELPDGKAASQAILELETRFAQAHWTRTELRDAEKRYNKYTVEELKEYTPNFPWSTFFSAADIEDIEALNLATPSYFLELEKILDETPVEVWKQYFKYHLVSAYADALSSDFVDASFELFGKELADVPKLKPRWKRAVEAISGERGFGVLGDAVGEIYVQKHFPEKAKERMDELVKNLLKAFEASITELTWMTDETKERALQKLAKITTKIGHTNKWRDYSNLDVKPDDLVGNLMCSAEVEYRRMIDKLGKPVDREEWHMTPQTINAYYNPGMNEIVFPAAILQPPFFDFEADDATNYGAIGSVIGHEISHAFDDQGSKYDGDGNLENWWTDADRKAFHKLTSQLVDQYAAYSPLKGKHLNGELTLGENIADLSGMSVAYEAYHYALNGETPPEIDGWTGKQRFFLGWAQAWRRKYREAEMINRLLVDPHSPSEFRSNGPVANFDPFYEAFDLTEGDELYKPRSERIRIW